MKTTIDVEKLAASALAIQQSLAAFVAELNGKPETARSEFKPAPKARKSVPAVKAIRLPSVADQYAALQAAVKSGKLGWKGCPGFIARKMRDALAAGKPFDPTFTDAIQAAYMNNRRFLA